MKPRFRLITTRDVAHRLCVGLCVQGVIGQRQLTKVEQATRAGGQKWAGRVRREAAK